MSRRYLIIGCALTVLVVAAASWLLFGRGHDSSAAHGSSAHAATTPASSAIPAATAGPQVAAALRHVATDPGSMGASGAANVGTNARVAVPAGSTVVPDASSWAPDGLGGGTMLVTVTGPDGHVVTYIAVMVREQGSWKVLATFPAVSPEPTR